MRNPSHVFAHAVSAALAFLAALLVVSTTDANRAPRSAGLLVLLTIGMGTTSLIQAAAADR